MSIQMTDIKVGDRIGREFGGGALMWLTVTEVTDEVIYCNLWTFDRVTGAEIDHDLQWGPQYGRTGSKIVRVQPAVEAA